MFLMKFHEKHGMKFVDYSFFVLIYFLIKAEITALIKLSPHNLSFILYFINKFNTYLPK